MYTRGELLTYLNKNINISIIDNHNESKIALDIIIYIIQNGERVLQWYYIIYTRRSIHIMAYIIFIYIKCIICVRTNELFIGSLRRLRSHTSGALLSSLKNTPFKIRKLFR